jgi:CheY-like chemotaxis protein
VKELVPSRRSMSKQSLRVRTLSRQYLQNQGYTVLEAGDGAVAVAICGTGVGRELARRIRAMRPETKVLFMSGYSENGVAQAPGAAQASTSASGVATSLLLFEEQRVIHSVFEPIRS